MRSARLCCKPQRAVLANLRQTGEAARDGRKLINNRPGRSSGAFRDPDRESNLTDAAIASGASGRYATALFELAKEQGALDAIESDLAQLEEALAASPELREMISSPVYSRENQGKAITALAGAMGLGRLSVNVLGLMASKGRLYALSGLIRDYSALLAAERGEITAEVASAIPLTDAQTDALKEKIRAAVGKDVSLTMNVDESLLGGLVVKVGSRMIDTSIRAKLASLQTVMKEVG